MPARIHHIALIANDPEQLASFYSGLLQTHISRRNFKNDQLYSLWLPLHPDGLLMIEQSDQPAHANSKNNPAFDLNPDRMAQSYHQRQAGLHLLAFWIEQEDLQTAREFVQARGNSIVDQSEYSIYFFDPEGNRVALSNFNTQEFR